MPKKRSQLPYSKPASSVHPALLTHSRDHAPDGSKNTSTGTDGVNDLIQHLRTTQVSATQQNERTCEGANPRTVHPSLRAMMNVVDTPAPRPRPGVRVHAVGGRRTRGPAGPPPPVSWTYSPLQRRSTTTKEQEISSSDSRRRYNDLLPGIGSFGGKSLYSTALKQLGRDWQWHAHYDQYYIAILPVWMKQHLLTSIAHNNEHPLEIKDLQLLFLDETQLRNATGSETVTHLDLSRSLINLKSLALYLTKKPFGSQASVSQATSGFPIPESWEDTPSPSISKPLSSLRFPCLTHLSLASLKSPSWSALLSILPLTATLTHLSLAHWPIPCLTPNSSTAYTSSPPGNIPHGGSNLYSCFDNDFSEPVGIMRRLSKATYCLRWFDLSGCTNWAVNVFETKDGPDWHGAWKGLETIRIQQSWRPQCIEDGRWVELLSYELGRRCIPDSSQRREFDLSETEKDEASDLFKWLNSEIYINSKLNMARQDMVTRYKTEHLVEDEGRAYRVPAVQRIFGEDSWWANSSGQARPEAAKNKSTGEAPAARRGVVNFDQGWGSHPQFKACIEAYLRKNPLGPQPMRERPLR